MHAEGKIKVSAFYTEADHISEHLDVYHNTEKHLNLTT